MNKPPREKKPSVKPSNSAKATVSAPAPIRRALLICNGQFQYLSGATIAGAAKDAENLSKILRDPERAGFEVTCLLDQGLWAVRKAIAKACEISQPADTLLIYLSGTSLKDSNGEFLMPVADTDEECPHATCIEADFILTQMRRSRCARFVLIIDGCYSGGFFVGNRGVPDGMIAITSCSASELSMDTPEGGAFTQSFIRAMSQSHASLGKEGALTVDDAYEFIRKDPKLIGDSPVHPQKWVWNLSEPIVLIRTSTSAFLSYAREDAELAEAVTHALDEQRISLWRDISGIPGGTEWRDSLVTAFAKAQALVLLMSEKALQSTWVRRELEYADSKGLPIVPVVTREVEIPDWFGLQFGGVQRVAINPADLAKNSAKLASTIRAAIKQRSTRSAG